MINDNPYFVNANIFVQCKLYYALALSYGIQVSKEKSASILVIMHHYFQESL